MKAMNSFFIVGYQGPKYFCNRKTKTLNSTLKTGGNMTLASFRQMEKTEPMKNTFYIYDYMKQSDINKVGDK